jgi:hypothetical protein
MTLNVAASCFCPSADVVRCEVPSLLFFHLREEDLYSKSSPQVTRGIESMPGRGQLEPK